jgi:hypothetical protein
MSSEFVCIYLQEFSEIVNNIKIQGERKVPVHLLEVGYSGR